MPGVFGTLLGLRNVTQRTNLCDAEQLVSSSGHEIPVMIHKTTSLCNPLIRGRDSI
jgi:hypothetical protein